MRPWSTRRLDLQSSGPPHRWIISPRFSTLPSVSSSVQPSIILSLPTSVLALFRTSWVQHSRPATSVSTLSFGLLTHVGSPIISTLHTKEPAFSGTEPHRFRRPEGRGEPNPRPLGWNHTWYLITASKLLMQFFWPRHLHLNRESK